MILYILSKKGIFFTLQPIPNFSKNSFKFRNVNSDSNTYEENTGKREVQKENAQLAIDLIKQPAGREAGKKQMSEVRDRRSEIRGRRTTETAAKKSPTGINSGWAFVF